MGTIKWKLVDIQLCEKIKAVVTFKATNNLINVAKIKRKKNNITDGAMDSAVIAEVVRSRRQFDSDSCKARMPLPTALGFWGKSPKSAMRPAGPDQ